MLYVVMLGGKHQKAKIEVHDVVFALGDTLADCYSQLKSQWFGDMKHVHIDSWMAVDGVDGYRIYWSQQAPSANQLRLFFINLGGYQAGIFGEDHRYLLVVAPDLSTAKTRGKQLAASLWSKPHTDNILDVDDCIAIDQVEGRYVTLVQEPHLPTIQQNDYIIL